MDDYRAWAMQRADQAMSAVLSDEALEAWGEVLLACRQYSRALADQGMDFEQIASSLMGSMAQELVRAAIEKARES